MHLKVGDSDARNMESSCQTEINSVTCASSLNYILEYYYDVRTHEHEIYDKIFHSEWRKECAIFHKRTHETNYLNEETLQRRLPE